MRLYLAKLRDLASRAGGHPSRGFWSGAAALSAAPAFRRSYFGDWRRGRNDGNRASLPPDQVHAGITYEVLPRLCVEDLHIRNLVRRDGPAAARTLVRVVKPRRRLTYDRPAFTYFRLGKASRAGHVVVSRKLLTSRRLTDGYPATP